MTTYTAALSLYILGPFLTAAPGPDVYGLDRIFHRDFQGQLVIPYTHIKGKLRSALEEITTQQQSYVSTAELNEWFGVEAEQGDYLPQSSLLKFSDFVCAVASQQETHTRTAIHTVTGTASENQLRSVERAFGSGAEIEWSGTLQFTATDNDTVSRIMKALQLGFSWLATLGGEQGVGYGRLRRVQLSKAQPISPSAPPTLSPSKQGLHLRIKPQEPIMAAGVKKPRTNFVASESILPGSLIKGALAAALNRSFGVKPVHEPLISANAAHYVGYAELVSHYDKVRVTHAFPVLENAPRAVRKPISSVEVDGLSDLVDMALSADPDFLVQGLAPRYFVDWKHSATYEGAATPRMVSNTRTEIDDTTRRAYDGRLFSYKALAPVDNDGNPVEWVCNVDFSAIPNDVLRQQVQDQFALAVAHYLKRMGKGARVVSLKVNSGSAPAAISSRATNDFVLVTLQSDTIMLNPEDVRALALDEDLHALYADYWHRLSSAAGMPASLVLEDFFSYQQFEGGYRYHRYLGMAERRSNPSQYRPFFLTGAGSVFKLRIQDNAQATQQIEIWSRSGLPLPAWAVNEYGVADYPLWQTCPYVPENGYGEIAVNLAWHWDHMIQPIEVSS